VKSTLGMERPGGHPVGFSRQPVATHGNGVAYLSRLGCRPSATARHPLRPLGSIKAPSRVAWSAYGRSIRRRGVKQTAKRS
jgi:hypothetical protein